MTKVLRAIVTAPSFGGIDRLHYRAEMENIKMLSDPAVGKT